ncbi:ATP-dependent DNA helicase Q-like 4A [Arachis ipaensis]|uniref:ATP-dependent DNA helicase Q-like 4A n=1 Tax=Arachis ipaensis TaxID=130454 RepID=UPI000A2B4DF8|nr:ATP-dependent DNA helicase Q-like 4A [Arachis ipaensis]
MTLKTISGYAIPLEVNVSTLLYLYIQIILWTCFPNTEYLTRHQDRVQRCFLQLAHFGEKFDSSTCQKTCDNCLKNTSFIEKDVIEIAKQLVELVKLTGQKVSSSHILEVYHGSLSQLVKKHRHDTLSLHGAGKHLAKGEASSRVRQC